MVKRKIHNIKTVYDILENFFKYNGKVFKKELRNNKVIRNIGWSAIESELKRNDLTLDDAVKNIGIQFRQGNNRKKKLININQFLVVLKNTFKYEGKVGKTEFINSRFTRNLGCEKTVRRSLKEHNLTLDDIAQQVGVQFKRLFNGMIGTNETQILNEKEKELGIKLERQFSVAGKFIDGYDLINNVAYEVDEWYHKYQKVEDIIRENRIKETLGCKFVVIKDE